MKQRAGARRPRGYRLAREIRRRRISADALRDQGWVECILADLTSSLAVRTLKDIIDFNEKNSESELKWFGQEHFLKAQECGPLTDQKYKEAVEKCRRLSRTEGIDAIMDKEKLDVLIAPTGGVAGKTDLIYGDHGAGGTSSLAAMAGYPNITVPAGQLYGLPLGMSFFGRAGANRYCSRSPILLSRRQRPG